MTPYINLLATLISIIRVFVNPVNIILERCGRIGAKCRFIGKKYKFMKSCVFVVFCAHPWFPLESLVTNSCWYLICEQAFLIIRCVIFIERFHVYFRLHYQTSFSEFFNYSFQCLFWTQRLGFFDGKDKVDICRIISNSVALN